MWLGDVRGAAPELLVLDRGQHRGALGRALARAPGRSRRVPGAPGADLSLL